MTPGTLNLPQFSMFVWAMQLVLTTYLLEGE